MSVTSLIAQLTERRRVVTGELRSTARPAIRQAVGALNPAQRAAVLAVLHNGTAEPDDRAALASARAVLLPQARSASQQELESLMLLALRPCIGHLQLRPPASVLRPAQPIRAIHLPAGTEHPVLHLDEYGLGPLLMGLLPHAETGQVNGVPGLRYRQHRRHGELFLAQTSPPARLFLAGVTNAVWKAALAFVTASYGEAPLSWLWDGPDRARLTEPERQHLASFRRIYGPAQVGSALFRRHRLLREAQRVEARDSDIDWVLEWGAGPSTDAVAAALTDPLFGLSFPVAVENLGPHTAWLVQRRGGETGAGTPRGVRLHLHREPGHDQVSEQEFRETHAATWPAWQTWQLVRRPAPSATASQARALRAAARRRASYTGEEPASALAGVTPDGRMGLDDCTPVQRMLRFLLAVYVFNTQTIGAPPSWRSVSNALRYTITISPRFDHLVIFADTPRNLVRYFVRSPYRLGVPGLRVVHSEEHDHYELVHLPTGATCTISRRHEAGLATGGDTARDGRLGAWPDSGGKTDLASIPPASDDMQSLLAGLFVRVACASPDKRWGLGNWWYDPLDRPDLPEPVNGDSRRLWGAGDDWQLLWEQYPYPADVVASLTDVFAGLAGVTAAGDDPFYSVSLGSACLGLAPWSAHRRWRGRQSAA